MADEQRVLGTRAREVLTRDLLKTVFPKECSATRTRWTLHGRRVDRSCAIPSWKLREFFDTEMPPHRPLVDVGRRFGMSQAWLAIAATEDARRASAGAAAAAAAAF